MRGVHHTVGGTHTEVQPVRIVNHTNVLTADVEAQSRPSHIGDGKLVVAFSPAERVVLARTRYSHIGLVAGIPFVLPYIKVAVGAVHVVVNHRGTGAIQISAHTVARAYEHGIRNVAEIESELSVGIDGFGGKATQLGLVVGLFGYVCLTVTVLVYIEKLCLLVAVGLIHAHPVNIHACFVTGIGQCGDA